MGSMYILQVAVTYFQKMLHHVMWLLIAAFLVIMIVASTREAPSTMSRAGAQQHHTFKEEKGELLTEDYCVDWLKTNMPNRDKGKLSAQRIRRHVQLALAARRTNTWAMSVPEQLWLNNVLAYRSVDEPLDDEDWRPMFFDKFMPLVQAAASLTEAAQIINREIWAFWGLKFVPDQTPEIMSVSQVLAKGYASCTGLSIFLVNACRAVGVPARIAGTPSWVVDRRDSPDERFNNHNWVEVWDDTWSFTGALEYNPSGLNKTWFFPQPAKGQVPGDHWHAIYAASFTHTGTVFPLAWAPDDSSVPGVDVTQVYIDATEQSVAPHASEAAAVSDKGLLQMV